MTTTTEIWTLYDLTLKVDKLVGGIPRSPDLITRWQEARKDKLPEGMEVEEAIADTTASLGDQLITDEDEAKAMWTGFCSRNSQLVLEERQVKAMLKESANIVKSLPGMRSVKADGTAKDIPLRARLAERVFVKPHWIPLGRSEPDGREDKVLHVMTRMGPRSALKRVDFCLDVELRCTLKVLKDGMITETVLKTILNHACENGLGADRSQGNGTFDYVLTETKEIKERAA